MKSKIKNKIKKIITPAFKNFEKTIIGFNNKLMVKRYLLTDELDINAIVDKIDSYCNSMEIKRQEKFVGYKHSASSSVPLLYDTVAVFLLKHLIGKKQTLNDEEISLILSYQKDDGLFYDKHIDCKQAYKSESWGWKHLTLHVLMTFSVFDYTMPKEIKYLEKFYDDNYLFNYLKTRNWKEGIVNTSNEIQNLGVMLQYARDYHNNSKASHTLEIIFDYLEQQQDVRTGLFGQKFDSKWDISYGVQAGYHFWLLYFYDGIEIKHKEKIIDYILQTQNILGGYGVQWNSSACEDIDSIDPLVRFMSFTDYRKNDIKKSLERAVPAILNNLNSDGGFVFRRHEPLMIVHKNMYSGENESNVFYTWFRTLGLAYALKALENDIPDEMKYNWNFKKAIGHQFL